MKDKVVLWGTAHRKREPGKGSPDGQFMEYQYSREIAAELKPIFQDYGYRTFIDMEEADLPRNMQSPSRDVELQRELALRVNYVNSLCREYGKENCIYVSIHNNASPPVDGKWHSGHGWQVNVGTKASDKSKLLAGCMAEAAMSYGLEVRKPTKQQLFWPQKLYVLNQTACPAVLTENMFMDNIDDLGFLLSDEGRHVIERVHVEGILRYFDSL